MNRFKFFFIFGMIFTTLFAGDFTDCTVKYIQRTKYDFESVFGEEAKNWVATLPTESQSLKVLYFSNKISLFKEDPGNDKGLPENLQEAIYKANYFKSPQPETREYYFDFNKNILIQEIEFMNRNFSVSGNIRKNKWKLTNNRIKIRDYTCFSAETKKGSNIITAWYTAEIPISSGPADFFGLPGIILAIEINGETAFLAQSIDTTLSAENLITIPQKGKKITEKKFNKIMTKKIKEYNAIKNSKSKEKSE